MTAIEFRAVRPLQALLLSASVLAIASPAMAAQVVFSTDPERTVELGERKSQVRGLTQIRLDGGTMLSFVDRADYRINADGSVDLYAGSVTVAGAGGSETVVRLPGGVEGRVASGAAASFTVTGDGTSRGHALTGSVAILRAGNTRTFELGEMWAADADRVRQVVSNGAQTVPEGDEVLVADMEEGGAVAAAVNGLPVSLGDALAAAGASGDVLAAARRVEAAAANPTLATFPTGDLALLVSYAAQLQGAYGAPAFPGAGPDIIRAYLGYLSSGGQGQNFLAAYADVLAQYLDLLRAGAVPSSFEGASLADLNAFVAYTGRTSGFGDLSAQNRALIEAYLAFLAQGGNPDLFVRSYTDLIDAYFAFLRAGGDPLAFQGASQQTLAAYIDFLADSGLAAGLSAEDRVLLEAYLANGGLAFVGQYRAALDAYFAFLAAGNLPSGYAGLDAATLRTYLETLQASGLFEHVLGARADFYAGFLAHLRAGGEIDAFAGLHANVFAGYAGQLAAYYDYLLSGGQPSAYAALSQQQIAAYLAALQTAGATDAFLADLAEFYSGYFAYLNGGGDPDLYTGLPSLNLPAFADALNAYAAFLHGGGLPSGYGAADFATLAQYLEALSRSGQLATLLGANADLLQAYFEHLSGGGAPDRFAGLPVYATYASALQTYYAYLDAGGLPTGYTALTQTQIQAYLAALAQAGGFGAQLGTLADFFTAYYAFLESGGNPVNFAGLPVYASYVSALEAYYAYLAAGGLPAGYTALSQAQIQAYLAALSQAGGFRGQLGNLADFFGAYYAFVEDGGNPAQFGGLPVYADYLAAIETYYAFLAGGGLPSAYTSLTPAQVRAYLEALSGAGLLAAEFEGEQLEFILAYLDYLQTGADPDQFAELPASDQTPTLAAGANVWIFSNEGGRTGAAPTADVEADGQITRTDYTTGSGTVEFDYTGPGNTLREHGRAGDNVAWTRYERGATGGVSNQNVHLLLGTPATQLPPTGTVDYRLIGGTAPTNAMAPAGEIGSFTGDLAVAFGTTPRVGLNFDVHVGARGWRAQTPGGAAGAATGGLPVAATMTFQASDLSRSGIAGNACSGYCNVQVFGGLFGPAAANAGFQYFIDDQSSGGRSYVNGVAVFGTSGTELAQIGTKPSTPSAEPVEHPAAYVYAGGFDTGSPATVMAHYAGYSGLDDKAVTLDADGTLLSAADSFYAPTGGDSVDVQGDALGLLGRFTGGDLTLFGSRQFNSIGANSGAHWIVLAAPSGTLPASGTIQYDLLAATRPTFNNGVTAPGTFDGDLSLTFAPSALTGTIGGRIMMPESGGDRVYSFEHDFTTTPETLALGLHLYDYQGVQGTGLACPTAGDCSVNISLAAGGTNGADRVGMTFATFGGSLSAPRITGAALFGAPASWPATGASGDDPLPGPASGAYADQYLLNLTYANVDVQYRSTVAYDAGGTITAWSRDNGSNNTVGQAGPADESGSVDGIVGWTRWLDRNNFADSDPKLPNTGNHLLSGTPATNLPASGKADYALVGQTRPTDRAGNFEPGTFTGSLAVDFATRKVGFDFDVALGEHGWNVRTSGGSADPGNGGYTLSLNNEFAVNPIVTGTAAASCSTVCSGNVRGMLFGPGASHVGAGYSIIDQAAGLVITGVATFAKP